VMCQNITAAANDLRPAQARVNLEAMVRRQLDLRRSETQAIQDKCDSLEHMFDQLKDLTLGIDAVSPSIATKGSEDSKVRALPSHSIVN